MHIILLKQFLSSCNLIKPWITLLNYCMFSRIVAMLTYFIWYIMFCKIFKNNDDFYAYWYCTCNTLVISVILTKWFINKYWCNVAWKDLVHVSLCIKKSISFSQIHPENLYCYEGKHSCLSIYFVMYAKIL